MGYEVNTKAYQLFIQIEVGIREFLIDLIKDKGVNDWFINFLGQFQRDSINVVVDRVQKAKKILAYPKIEDQFRYKLARALKDNMAGLMTKELYHPFYYLNWPDMEIILNKKTNIDLIDKSIGRKNRDVISNNLNVLNEIRNHIAHSRFITDGEYVIVKSAFDQISAVIPNFSKYYCEQSKEDKLDSLLKKLSIFSDDISKPDMFTITQIQEFSDCIDSCINSFWLNSIYPVIVEKLFFLKSQMNLYKEYRSSPGGLYKIVKWKEENSIQLSEIINIINNGKI